MSNLSKAVGEFLAERANFITAINNCPASNMDDYWRWQGNAEARRVLRETLDHRGINLAAEPAPVADRKHIAANILGPAICKPDWSLLDLTDAVIAANVFRDEATVKAEALREAATAAREEAASSRTNNGRCESESLADWLDDRAAAIDPARLEGAHP